jgi:hypothetical protein
MKSNIIRIPMGNSTKLGPSYFSAITLLGHTAAYYCLFHCVGTGCLYLRVGSPNTVFVKCNLIKLQYEYAGRNKFY